MVGRDRVFGAAAACNASHAVEARLSRWLLRACDLNDSENLPLKSQIWRGWRAASCRCYEAVKTPYDRLLKSADQGAIGG